MPLNSHDPCHFHLATVVSLHQCLYEASVNNFRLTSLHLFLSLSLSRRVTFLGQGVKLVNNNGVPHSFRINSHCSAGLPRDPCHVVSNSGYLFFAFHLQTLIFQSYLRLFRNLMNFFVSFYSLIYLVTYLFAIY